MSTIRRIRSRPRLWFVTIAIRGLDRVGATNAIARLAARFVKPITKVEPNTDPLPYTVLVLDATRFRGDPDLYSASGRLRFVTLNWEFLRALLMSFVDQAWTDEPDRIVGASISPRGIFHAASTDSDISRQRARYRSFLRRFIPLFFERVGVDVVITSDLRFRRQTDFCRVASALGYPYLLFQRESMFIVDSVFKLVVDRHRPMGLFWGDAIVVQNDVTKDLFLASDTCDESRIFVVGCARMDGLIGRLENEQNCTTRIIALFSAPDHVAGEFSEIATVMAPMVRAAARVAKSDPTVQLRIKLKDFTKADRQRRRKAAYENAIQSELGEIPLNITFVTERMAAHDLILSASVIIAMQSTVVLEAALTGKPVILPHFKFLREHPDASHYLMYLDLHDLFDVPEDEADLERILRERLVHSDVPKDVMAARRDLFDRHVSPLDCTATERGVELICQFAKNGKLRRQGENEPE